MDLSPTEWTIDYLHAIVSCASMDRHPSNRHSAYSLCKLVEWFARTSSFCKGNKLSLYLAYGLLENYSHIVCLYTGCMVTASTYCGRRQRPTRDIIWAACVWYDQWYSKGIMQLDVQRAAPAWVSAFKATVYLLTYCTYTHCFEWCAGRHLWPRESCISRCGCSYRRWSDRQWPIWACGRGSWTNEYSLLFFFVC